MFMRRVTSEKGTVQSSTNPIQEIESDQLSLKKLLSDAQRLS